MSFTEIQIPLSSKKDLCVAEVQLWFDCRERDDDGIDDSIDNDKEVRSS